MTNKSKIRWLFALVLVIYVLEFAIKLKFEEPYPAIVYPAFGDIPNISRPIKTVDIEALFNNNDSSEIDKKTLFYNLPGATTTVLLRENFTKNRSFLTPVVAKKSFTINIGFNHFKVNYFTLKSKKQRENGIKWFRNRLTSITHREDLKSMKVKWYTTSFDKEGNPLKNPAEEFLIDF